MADGTPTIETTALVLLAAGLSRRFGPADKLGADLWGRPLGLHAAIALEELPFLTRIAVVDAGGVDYAAHGFGVARNPDPSRGLASSLWIGVAAARESGADAVLVVLADMPCVTAAHVRRMFKVAGGQVAVVASTDGESAKPPALFGRGVFDQLLALEGERGAGALIRAGRLVEAPEAELVDVDTPEELARLQRSR